MRGRKKDFEQMPILLIRRWVEQENQDECEGNENAGKCGNPTPFAQRHPRQKNHREKRQSQIAQAEFLRGLFPVHISLAAIERAAAGHGIGQRFCVVTVIKNSRQVRGRNAVILAPGKGVLEALFRARVGPVHRRIGHRSQRHIQIKRRPQQPCRAGVEHWHPMAQ